MAKDTVRVPQFQPEWLKIFCWEQQHDGSKRLVTLLLAIITYHIIITLLANGSGISSASWSLPYSTLQDCFLIRFHSPGITMIWNWKMPSTQPSWLWRCNFQVINFHKVCQSFTYTPFTVWLQESFEGQMTEENIEVGICNEAGFKRLTPAEVKDYLSAIAWAPSVSWWGSLATCQHVDMIG